MKALIVYASKSGNTGKVAEAIRRGLPDGADMCKLDLNTQGVLLHHTPGFTFDLAPYDVVFLGSWVMIMKVHPFLAAYINRMENAGQSAIVGFMTGGAIFSRDHVHEDFNALLERRGVQAADFLYFSTLLGPLLTQAKLRNAEQFGRDVAARLG